MFSETGKNHPTIWKYFKSCVRSRRWNHQHLCNIQKFADVDQTTAVPSKIVPWFYDTNASFSSSVMTCCSGLPCFCVFHSSLLILKQENESIFWTSLSQWSCCQLVAIPTEYPRHPPFPPTKKTRFIHWLTKGYDIHHPVDSELFAEYVVGMSCLSLIILHKGLTW